MDKIKTLIGRVNAEAYWSLLSRFVVPLKFFILTPLLFTSDSITKWQLDLYYLSASSALITHVLTARLAGVALPILSDSFNKKENLDADFAEYFYFFKVLCSLLLPIFVGVSCWLLFWNVTFLDVPVDQYALAGKMVIAAVLVQHVNLATINYRLILQVNGRWITFIKVETVALIMLPVAMATAILFNMGILVALYGSIMVSLLQIAYLHLITRKFKTQYVGHFKKMLSKLSVLFRKVSILVVKSIGSDIGNLFVLRLSQVMVSMLGVSGLVAGYSLLQNMIMMISSIAFSPLYSQFPAVAKLFSQGRLTDGISLGKKYFKFGVGLYATGVLCTTVLLFYITKFDTNFVFLGMEFWFFMVICLTSSLFLKSFMHLVEVTNRFPFLKRNLFACAIAVLGMLVAVHFDNVYGVILAVSLPQLVLINWYPWVIFKPDFVSRKIQVLGRF